jgi:AcrR family transcriptional regulator
MVALGPIRSRSLIILKLRYRYEMLNDPVSLEAATKTLSTSQKSVRKREVIIRAAIEIINNKSYALATMSEIAAVLDLRNATLYYYYPNKRALAYACHRHSLERFERLLHEASASNGTGLEKLELFIRSMLVESDRSGPLLYFGDYSYLESKERKVLDSWAVRLSDALEQLLKDGIADGSIVKCETGLVVNLLLGMLIWLGKWVPSVEGLTVERLMNAIKSFSLLGIQSRDFPSSL